MREANTLADLIRFSEYVPSELTREIQKAVEGYAHRVVKYEWQALGHGRRDQRAEELFSDLITTVVARDRMLPPDSREYAFHVRLIDIARTAGEQRGERVAESMTRIPPTLFGFVNIIAAVLLLLVLVYPFHQAGVGASCMPWSRSFSSWRTSSCGTGQPPRWRVERQRQAFFRIEMLIFR